MERQAEYDEDVLFNAHIATPRRVSQGRLAFLYLNHMNKRYGKQEEKGISFTCVCHFCRKKHTLSDQLLEAVKYIDHLQDTLIELEKGRDFLTLEHC